MIVYLISEIEFGESGEDREIPWSIALTEEKAMQEAKTLASVSLEALLIVNLKDNKTVTEYNDRKVPHVLISEFDTEKDTWINIP